LQFLAIAGYFERDSCWGFLHPHARTGGVLIIAQRRDSTLTQYFTWFGKSAYIHGRVYIIEIYRERITIYMEEEDHFTLSTPSS
jgi:hypothetical protein